MSECAACRTTKKDAGQRRWAGKRPPTQGTVWEYSNDKLEPPFASRVQHGDSIFFSPTISSAQRLPNGNTLIDEGSGTRIIEVTPDLEVVEEYVRPYNYIPAFKGSVLYRASAVPYDYMPQLKKPVESAVEPPWLGQIVLPDVNGKLSDYQPRLDKNLLMNFGQPMPVMMSAYSAPQK